ncbi:MAG: DUF3536 domain-containing protein [Deltaproteobacteria bacterium]|nr:DUF3536 domain-containing protein [Deltaproteobacteria bacterium]
MALKRYVCLHGHFYQPPRENPWLEEIEVQDSAAPFHDWNERISAECHGPNAAARLKSPEGRITDIVNNYLHLSYNCGPTLLSWLERTNPGVYAKVLEADAISYRRCGHGNAIAQAYNHAILPLSTQRDRLTQIRWGVADFRHRFGRDPEGFWLPETAANLATLRDLASEGILFTVLSPLQARRVRAPAGDWQDASGGRFDPTRPYKVVLGGGLEIAVFFYDAPIAQRFAFGGAGTLGEEVVQTLEAGFNPERGHDELLVVAVDGETFGHHRRGFDEALAQAFRLLSARNDIELVNLGQALKRIPATWEAEILEGSSWSCAHGVERWRSDCGCSNSGQAGWKQHWRAPLRDALDTLRVNLSEIFERHAAALLKDPWAARDAYIEPILDHEPAGADAFLERHAGRRLDEAETTRALKLLEMQRHALLMYTSCAWFFAELSGLETVQNLKYAARALELAREVSGIDLEPLFKDALARAPSNLPHYGNGVGVWDACVRPARVSKESLAAQFAIAWAVEGAEAPRTLGCYSASIEGVQETVAESARLAVGRLTMGSRLDREKLEVGFCVLGSGGSDLRCRLRPYLMAQHSDAERALLGPGKASSLEEVRRKMEQHFPGTDRTLRDLGADERRRLTMILRDQAMREQRRVFLDLHETNRQLLEHLRDIGAPAPAPLRAASEVVLSERLRVLSAALAEGSADRTAAFAELVALVQEAQRLGVALETRGLERLFEQLIRVRLEGLAHVHARADRVLELKQLVDFGERLGLHLNLAMSQDYVWSLVAAPDVPMFDPDTLERLAAILWFAPAALKSRARRPVEEQERSGGLALASAG